MNKYSKGLRWLFILLLMWIAVGLPAVRLFAYWRWGWGSSGDGEIIILYGYWAAVYMVLWLTSTVVLITSFVKWRRGQDPNLLAEKRVLSGWMMLHLVLFFIPIAFIVWLQVRSLTPVTVPVNCPAGIVCEIKYE